MRGEFAGITACPAVISHSPMWPLTRQQLQGISGHTQERSRHSAYLEQADHCPCACPGILAPKHSGLQLSQAKGELGQHNEQTV